MMTIKLKYIFCSVVLTILISCAKPVDFDQANDLRLEPVLESSIFFFNAKAGDFFTGGSEQSVVQDFIELDIFNNSITNDNLVRLEFVIETENSIRRSYNLQVDFLDVNGQLLESFNVNATASNNNEIVAQTHLEVFEATSLNRIKQTEILVFTLTMLPGNPITPNSPGVFNFKSKGVLYFDVDL